MRTRRHIPSLKTIRRGLDPFFNHDSVPENAAKLRKVLEDWRDGGIRSREMLDTANALLNAHGVESITSENERADAYYVNMGDTYTTTVLLDLPRDTVFITDYGSYVEKEERAGNRFR